MAEIHRLVNPMSKLAEKLDDDDWWTPGELAKRWRTSVDSIRRRHKAGEIRAMPCGASFRVHRDEIARHEMIGLPPLAQPRIVKPFISQGLLRAAIRRVRAAKTEGGSLA